MANAWFVLLAQSLFFKDLEEQAESAFHASKHNSFRLSLPVGGGVFPIPKQIGPPHQESIQGASSGTLLLCQY